MSLDGIGNSVNAGLSALTFTKMTAAGFLAKNLQYKNAGGIQAALTHKDVADISEEAKKLSKEEKAKPSEIAKLFGNNNPGDLINALRKAGVQLTGEFIGDLLHGDPAALERAKQALTLEENTGTLSSKSESSQLESASS